MRILVGWDDAEQAELLELYLSVEDTDVSVVITWETLQQALAVGSWDVLLVTLGKPEHELELSRFEELRRRFPRLPIVGACRINEVYRMAGFLIRGMRSYVVRDAAGDYMFLVHTLLQRVTGAEPAGGPEGGLQQEIAALQTAEDAMLARAPLPRDYTLTRTGQSKEGLVVASPRGDGRVGVVAFDAGGCGIRAAASFVALAVAARHGRTSEILADFRERMEPFEVPRLPLLVLLVDPMRHEVAWSSGGLALENPSDFAGDLCFTAGTQKRFGDHAIGVELTRRAAD